MNHVSAPLLRMLFVPEEKSVRRLLAVAPDYIVAHQPQSQSNISLSDSFGRIRKYSKNLEKHKSYGCHSIRASLRMMMPMGSFFKNIINPTEIKAITIKNPVNVIQYSLVLALLFR